jgi:hypothetical protein
LEENENTVLPLFIATINNNFFSFLPEEFLERFNGLVVVLSHFFASLIIPTQSI